MSAAASRVALGAVLAVVAAAMTYVLCAIGLQPELAVVVAFASVFGSALIGGVS